jgi:hypothetical protein
MRIAILSVLLALVCAAETSVAPPSIGLIQDCQGHTRRVFGTPGAFLLGPPQAVRSVRLLSLPEGARIEGRNLIVRRGDGSEKRISLPEPAGELQSLDGGWLVAPPFAIRPTADGAAIYRLPMKGCTQ